MRTSNKITEYLETRSTRSKDIQNTMFLWCSFCFFCLHTLEHRTEMVNTRTYNRPKLSVKNKLVCEICSAFIYSCAASYIIHSKFKIRQICDSLHMPDFINLEVYDIQPLWQHFHILNFSYLCYTPKWKDIRYVL